MIRLLLNAEDLAKVRLRSFWSPFTESWLSLLALRHGLGRGLIDGWAESVRGRLGAENRLLDALAVEPRLDLHTVAGPGSTIEEALEAIERAPADHLRTELAVLGPALERAEPWARAWVRDLAEGDRRARRELARRFDEYHRQAVDPHWDGMRRYLDAEVAQRATIMAEAGVDRLLATLHPQVRWYPPWLDVGMPPGTPLPGEHGHPEVERWLQVLDGRSLVVVPTIFDLDAPAVLWSVADETLPFVLIYPAVRDTGDARALWSTAGPDHRALAMLLGRTRARALEAIAGTCTTSELAQRLGVSPPTISHHVGVLRDAGLIASRRTGATMVHYATARGAALLED